MLQSLSWYLGKRVKSALYIWYTSIIVPKVQWGSGLRKRAWHLKNTWWVFCLLLLECWASKKLKKKQSAMLPSNRPHTIFFSINKSKYTWLVRCFCVFAKEKPKHVKCVVFLQLMTALFQKAGFRMGRVTEVLTGEAELELRGGVFLREEGHSALWEGAISINNLCLSIKNSYFEGESSSSHKIKQRWI